MKDFFNFFAEEMRKQTKQQVAQIVHEVWRERTEQRITESIDYPYGLNKK